MFKKIPKKSTAPVWLWLPADRGWKSSTAWAKTCGTWLRRKNLRCDMSNIFFCLNCHFVFHHGVCIGRQFPIISNLCRVLFSKLLDKQIKSGIRYTNSEFVLHNSVLFFTHLNFLKLWRIIFWITFTSTCYFRHYAVCTCNVYTDWTMDKFSGLCFVHSTHLNTVLLKGTVQRKLGWVKSGTKQ